MVLLDFLLKLASFLTPKDIREAGPVQNWRNRISGWVILLTFGTAGVVYWTETSFLSIADADEIHEKINKNISSIDLTLKEMIDLNKSRDIRQLRSQILETTKSACKAPKDSPLREELFNQLSDLRSEYMAKVGTEYPPISCSDIIGQ